MKNLILAAILSFISLTAFAQSNIKVGYQGVYFPHVDEDFFGPSVAFEAALRNRLSLNVNFGVIRDHEVTGPDVNVITRGIRVEPEVRFYFSKGLKGLFFGPRLSYTSLSSVLRTDKERVDFPTWGGEDAVFGMGGVIGFQADFSEHLKLSVVGGLEIDNHNGEGAPSLGVSLGYRF
jgi:hypothetical protein